MVRLNIKRELHASSGPFQLVIDLSFEKGSFTSITGPSGSGKTSLLRMISGLMRPDDGSILYDGEVWFDKHDRIDVSTKKRKVGFLFQDYALFPNMTVLQNLKYAAGKENEEFIDELVEVMDIEGFLEKNPNLLSGGQQQRVALARALVRKPKLLLLDEPLSALDAYNREKIQFYLKKAYKKYNLTVLMVTHNAPEIIRLSDVVIKLENGKIAKQGTIRDFFYKAEDNNNYLNAEVIKKHITDKQYCLTLLIGDQIIEVKVSDTEFQNVEEAAKVKIQVNEKLEFKTVY
ncbi:MAG: ATP-binding cassette domain-containing protein [Cyclobacteriaceae bacterium]|nr:ATP-binding cassette domain-containing protein [Cyclobacteriaceae bacterium]